MKYNRFFQRYRSEIMGFQSEMTYAWEISKQYLLLIAKEEIIASDSCITNEIEINRQFEEQMKRDLALYDQESE